MSEFTLPLDIESLEVIGQQVDKHGNIIFDVCSKSTGTRCHKCGKHATKRYGYAPEIEIRHLSILDRTVYLRIKPVRYQCEHCDDHPTTTEQYDWCSRGSKITHGLEDYLMRSLIHSTVQDVSQKEHISYKTVVAALNRKISTEVDWSNHIDLETIGIDEISLKKGHNDYVTVISARTRAGQLVILAVLSGRSYDATHTFLNSIPTHLKTTVKSVCTDMHDGFVSAALDVFGPRIIVVDRYHVSKLYRKPLDKLRIKEMRRLKEGLTEDEYTELEGMMWILRKKHECLSKDDKTKLDLLYKHSPELKKAHQYALKLTQIFNTHNKRKSGMAKIERWIASVERSNLTCFNTFIKTLKKYKPYIANYFKGRKNSGFVEGLNNKIKVLKRRCYGLFKTESLFQRIFLDLNGQQLFI